MATRNRRTQNVSCKPNWLLTKLFYCHRSSVFNLIRFIDLCPHPLRQILSCHVVVLRAKDAPGSAEHTFTTRWSRRYPEVLSCHSGEIWQERFVPWPPLQNISLYVGIRQLKVLLHFWSDWYLRCLCFGWCGLVAGGGYLTHECCERAKARAKPFWCWFEGWLGGWLCNRRSRRPINSNKFGGAVLIK